MFTRTIALLESGRAQFDDSCFSFGYGVNDRATADLDAVVSFFGQSFFAEAITGVGGRELFIDSRALREIDRARAHRAVVQLLKNDFRMFSVRPVDTAALEELVLTFFEEVGDCRVFSNTLVYSSDHAGDCLGPWTAVTRSSRDTFVCTVSDKQVAYWVYSDDE